MILAWNDGNKVGEHPHAEVIGGLLHLVGYLTDNPYLPAPSGVEVLWLMPGDNSERVAAVRHVAKAFGRDMVWENGNTRVSVAWPFPGLRFWAMAELVTEEVSASTEADDTQQLPPLDAWDEPLPEVSCELCEGSGLDRACRSGGTCPHCLGKGRIAAWVPQEASAW